LPDDGRSKQSSGESAHPEVDDLENCLADGITEAIPCLNGLRSAANTIGDGKGSSCTQH
jgi:hypothetical protein